MRGERSGYSTGGGGGLADETSEGSEVGPNVSEEDEGLSPEVAVDR